MYHEYVSQHVLINSTALNSDLGVLFIFLYFILAYSKSKICLSKIQIPKAYTTYI